MKGLFKKLLIGTVCLCLALTFGLAACAPAEDVTTGGGNGGGGGGSGAVYQGDECIDLTITSMPTKLEYLEGEMFSPAGLKFDAVYANGYDGDTGLDWNDLDSYTRTPLTADMTEVTVTFEGFDKSIAITVTPRTVKSVEITHEPDIKSYNVGDELNLAGLTVKVEYEDGLIDENMTEYTVTDAAGNVYETGTVLNTVNNALELTVTVGSGENVKTDTFKIVVFEGFTIQAEDNTVVENASYTVLNTSGGKGEIKRDATYTGSGYIGSIEKGFVIEFHIYVDTAIEGAELVLVSSSTCQNAADTAMEDMIVKDLFAVSFNGETITIPDTTVIEGKLYPAEGSIWTNWADVVLGTVDLKEGDNVLRIECIGTQTDHKDGWGRTPNIDRLDIRAASDASAEN